jgi:hypothetical protein
MAILGPEGKRSRFMAGMMLELISDDGGTLYVGIEGIKPDRPLRL